MDCELESIDVMTKQPQDDAIVTYSLKWFPIIYLIIKVNMFSVKYYISNSGKSFKEEVLKKSKKKKKSTRDLAAAGFGLSSVQ